MRDFDKRESTFSGVKTTLIAALFLVRSLTGAAETNTYSNPTLGISVTKPSDWVFTTAQHHAENLKAMKLDDQELQKMMQKYSTAPLVAMMKHPEPFADVNPSFTIKPRPLGELPANDPVAILKVILPTLEKTFNDLKVVEPAKEMTIGGQKGAYMRINYNLQTGNGGSFPTCSEMWVVPRGRVLFIIGAGTRQDEKTGTRAEIRKILESVKIE